MEKLSIFSLEDLDTMYQRMLALLEDEFKHVSENAPKQIKEIIEKEREKIEDLIQDKELY